MINTTHAHAHVQDDRELVQYLNAGRNHAKTISTIKIELCAHRSALHRQRSQPHPTQDPMAVKPTGDRTHRAYRKRRP